MIAEGTQFVPESPYEVTQAGIDNVLAVLGGPPSASGQAPPTFVNIVLEPAVRLFLTSGELPIAGVVHTSEAVTYTRLLKVGDVVRTSLEVVSIRARAKVTQFEVIGRITDLDGHELARVSSSLMCETEATE